jgi:threonylcarbamoyladenosine tRNA methylthiotransferase MtaB
VPTFHIENFGCRATQADGAAIAGQFEARGLTSAAASAAEIVLLNTCTVTASADQDARAAVRRVRRENPKAKIFVTGCYAQRAPEEVAALPGVAAVIGNSHKHALVDVVLGTERPASSGSGFVPVASLSGELRQEQSPGRMFISDIFAHTELLAAPVFDAGQAGAADWQRTRPNLKVQDGCDNRCSFCIIPSVRGQSRSLPLAQVIGEVNGLVEAGFREVVISGINLGRWGRDLQGAASGFRGPASGFDLGSDGPESGSWKPGSDTLRFETLVRAILEETRLEKLRISSVEPMDWSHELIELVASSPRIAQHAHVPLQSGSDAVLRRMHRKYRPWHYREKIERIHAAMPAAAIGADVMTGFPGETDAEFECTRRLIEELPFTYLHVFTYSSRPGTASAAMPKQVPVQVARERNKVLRELAAEKKRTFMQSFVGKTLAAITLTTTDVIGEGAVTKALTDNYLKLDLIGKHAPNCWVEARIDGVENHALRGRAVTLPR